MREKPFENKIKKYLDDIGAWYIKYWAGAQFTKSGIPDILACVNGSFVAIEVKGDGGKPSPLQEYHIEKINNCGGYAVIVYPDDWEQLKEDLDELNGKI